MSSTKAKTPWLDGVREEFNRAIAAQPQCSCASRRLDVHIVRKLIPVGKASMSVDTCKRCKGVVR